MYLKILYEEKDNMKTVMLVFGTRPEAIKMCPLVTELKTRKKLKTVVCVTGQHRQMLDQVLNTFNVIPDYDLSIMKQGQTLFDITTGILEKIKKVLEDVKPDVVLVHGDTSTTFVTALACFYLQIPVGHVEAGLRSYNIYSPYPEEFNRQAVGIISQYNFAPTQMAADNLIKEGKNPDKIFITGNTVVDACFRHLEIANKAGIQEESLANLDIENMDNILTLTMHRAENVDDKERLINIISSLKELKDMNIIFPIHPRTKKTLENFNLFDELNELDNVHIIKPLGYLDFLILTSHSTLILTDSGGLQEEAITLDVPVLTLRYNTERPETVSAGGNILVGANKNNILENAKKILNDEEFANKMKNAKNPYGKGDAAIKTIDAIEEAYNSGLLDIKAPENIMSSFDRKMIKINEDVSVKEFEENENALVHMVFDGEKMIFPLNNLNLKGMMITYDVYQ